MTTSELIAQNPVLWLVCTFGGAVITAVGVTWKVLKNLLVEPRDDRIKVLTQDSEKERRECAQLRQDQERRLEEFRKQLEELLNASE